MGHSHDAHPVLHLGRNAIIADHWPRIAQAAGLPLHHEAPQRVARCGDQIRPRFAGFGGQKAGILGGNFRHAPIRGQLVCSHTIGNAGEAAIKFGKRL